MSKLFIQPKVLGPVSTNCYILINEETKEAIIIDPADEPEKIQEVITREAAKPVAILLTHGHFDHIKASDDLREQYHIPVYAQEAEEKVIKDANLNLSSMFGNAFTRTVTNLVKDKDILNIAQFDIQVLHTPGHTCGSCCYYLKEQNVIFTGDTLFLGSVGRTDFPTSSTQEMIRSIRTLLKELPQEVVVYPGHDSFTTIEYEKRNNPYA